MVIALDSPVGTNFLKDFPALNETNCNKIDDYAGPCLTTDALQTYTPQLVGTSTDPVLGTGGLIRGFYYKIFDQIYVWGEFRFGTAAINIGLGTYLISLPFAADSVLGANTNLGSSPVIGNGYVQDSDVTANRTPITVHLRTTTQMAFGCKMENAAAQRVVSNNIPFTWAINDGLIWHARYKRAA